MHAVGLYPPPLPHFMNPRNRAVSPMYTQGTPDVEETERMQGASKTGRGPGPGEPDRAEGTQGEERGQERRDAEASLATLTTERLIRAAQPLCRCADAVIR
nr:hypothetical protein StreXyl84_18620 [Streptomyces sp. Xyl84]